jgi:uncharacterized membrane protein YbhN (UPF0104 family)
MPKLFRLPPHHVHATGPRLAIVLGLEVALYMAAAVGMAYVAGFEGVRRALENPDWPWLFACLAMVPPAFVGYYLGYRPVFRVEDGRLQIDRGSRLAVVAAGFGGFLDHGGGAIDRVALRSAGASEREASVRVTMLSALEHGVLALPCAVAAAWLLASGIRTPSTGFTLPWVIGPAVGFALGWWVTDRFRTRLRRRRGWLGRRLSVLVDAAHLVLTMARSPRRYALPLAGMLVFWLADIFALWAAMAAFRFHMNGWAVVVAFGTAMIVTRRNGPLGGVGILDLALPPTLWVSGALFAPAVLGTFVYRFFTLWLPLPFALATLPRLRTLIAR